MTLDNRSPRIVSMDQFRGYTVAGMLLVNYIGDMDAFHDVLKHHSVYFSYADSIMPSFLFAVGYSFRLTVLRRLPQLGTTRTCWTYVRRSLSLILISLMFFGFGAREEVFGDWQNYSWQAAWHLVTRIIKADLWETLALIGVTQIFLLPFIGKSLKFRAITLLVCLAMHAVLAYLFNFNFVHQQPNAFEDLLVKYFDWGATDKRCWESGPFGILNWSVAMLSGAIAYDIVSGNTAGKAVGKLLSLGVLLMAAGYSFSCMTRLYDVDKGEGEGVTDATTADSSSATESRSGHDAVEPSSVPWGAPPQDLQRFAVSPVLPPLGRAQGRDIKSLLAEPPFMPPPDQSVRRINYWMMTKQLPSPSFILFASGFAFALFSLFVIACDIGPVRIGLFRTFGQNPLATYLLHYVVALTLHTVSPNDAPLSYCLASVAVFFLIVYGLIRGLEKQGIYIRL
ncbi:MAG: heparan-alpha-glucosaminide N-acetyltransferase domain-containing protein [Planctomycetaceae bacterium]